MKKANSLLGSLSLFGAAKFRGVWNVFEDSARNICRVGGTSGPTQDRVITFLGIVIDSGVQQLHLPQEKQSACLQGKLHTKNCELLSLIHHLYHAEAVVVPGITLLPHLIKLSSTVCHLHTQARYDLLWWLRFVVITSTYMSLSHRSASCEKEIMN